MACDPNNSEMVCRIKSPDQLRIPAMRRPLVAATLLLALMASRVQAQDPKEDLWSGARKGDPKAVAALLAKGVDVNAQTPYGATALHFAADKGHLEVVRLLLQHKAKANLKDTFYSATPITWAQMRNHWEVVKELVDAGAENAAALLTPAVKAGKLEVVRAILAKNKVPETTLSAALAAAAKQPEIAKMLKEAGAKVADPAAAPAKPTLTAQALAAYAGAYEGDEIAELTLVVKDAKLNVEMGGRSIMVMEPAAADKFKIANNDSLSVEFQREGDKIASLTLKNASNSFVLRRADPNKAKAASAKPVIPDEKSGVVKVPLSWPSFRGPHASGIADGQFPPVTWDVKKGTNVVWKTPIPGLGHSCPIVWGNCVFITTAISGDPKAEFKPGLYGDVDSVNDTTVHSWHVFCLDKRTGKILWDRCACEGVPKVKPHMKGSHANSTPASDGKHVLACFGSEGLYYYDFGGKLLWKCPLGTLDSGWFYDPSYQWGFGSSPIIFHNRVILQCDVGKGSFLAAYDIETGKPIWSTPREEIPSWGTPTIYESNGHVELITNATKFIRGYDPETGKECWRLGRNAEITTPTPIWNRDLIFVTSGYRPIQPIYAIRPGAKGDITLKEKQETNGSIA
jgi:outer membrane protein assembly factor BamB